MLSLIVALLLLAASIALFTGGLGPILMASRMAARAPDAALLHWAGTAVFLAAWWAGIGSCIVRARSLLRSIGSAPRRGWQAGDVLVVLGHLVFLVAVASLLLGVLTMRHELPVYPMLMAGAACYAVGLGALALGPAVGNS